LTARGPGGARERRPTADIGKSTCVTRDLATLALPDTSLPHATSSKVSRRSGRARDSAPRWRPRVRRLRTASRRRVRDTTPPSFFTFSPHGSLPFPRPLRPRPRGPIDRETERRAPIIPCSSKKSRIPLSGIRRTRRPSLSPRPPPLTLSLSLSIYLTLVPNSPFNRSDTATRSRVNPAAPLSKVTQYYTILSRTLAKICATSQVFDFSTTTFPKLLEYLVVHLLSPPPARYQPDISPQSFHSKLPLSNFLGNPFGDIHVTGKFFYLILNFTIKIILASLLTLAKNRVPQAYSCLSQTSYISRIGWIYR
jgi:hypothetical protein